MSTSVSESSSSSLAPRSSLPQPPAIIATMTSPGLSATDNCLLLAQWLLPSWYSVNVQAGHVVPLRNTSPLVAWYARGEQPADGKGCD